MYAHVYDQGVKHTWIRSCNMSIDTLSGCYNRFVLYMDPNSVRRKTTHTLTHTHTHTHTQTHTQHLMSTRSCNLSIEKLSSGWTARLILHVRTMCSQLRKFYPRSDCTLGSGARTQHPAQTSLHHLSARRQMCAQEATGPGSKTFLLRAICDCRHRKCARLVLRLLSHRLAPLPRSALRYHLGGPQPPQVPPSAPPSSFSNPSSALPLRGSRLHHGRPRGPRRHGILHTLRP
jgi:hypothetical protein